MNRILGVQPSIADSQVEEVAANMPEFHGSQ
jgi:hypothetical protein